MDAHQHSSSSLREYVRARLARMSLRVLPNDFAREAAVMMPIFEEDGVPCFLLTRRTEDVLTHKGQISFPGGMRHGGEALSRTALRETHEEVGIDPGSIDVLGAFHEYLAITEYRVRPFAGFLAQPFETRPQPREVAEVLHVPFHVFRDPSRLTVRRMFRLGEWMDVYYYQFGRHEIWGLTARIIHDFLRELEL